MADWLDYDEQSTPEELAEYLEVDVRFFRIAESAGLTFDRSGTITARSFWLWYGTNFEKFRRAAGMRELSFKKTLRGKERERARFDAALLTIIEFFGVLPCEKAVSNATEVFRTAIKGKKRR